MTMPAIFTIYPVAPEPTFWPVDDPLVEKLWLPLIGPTPFVLLRHLDHAIVAQADDVGTPVTFKVDDVAEHLGVHHKRAFESVLRLRRFHLIEDDNLTTTYANPSYCFRRCVRPIGVKEWRRLPASVREHYASMPL